MKLLFVKSEKIGSRIIRWGTGEPVSHVALDFNQLGRVFHSYAIGIKEEDHDTFPEMYETVAKIDFGLTKEQEKHVLDYMLSSIPDRQTYDYPAMMYFTWRAFLHKYFKRPYPRFNEWQETDGFLCTEITYLTANALAEVLSIMVLPEGYDISMVTPWKLYELFTQRITQCNFPFSFSASSSR